MFTSGLIGNLIAIIFAKSKVSFCEPLLGSISSMLAGYISFITKKKIQVGKYIQSFILLSMYHIIKTSLYLTFAFLVIKFVPQIFIQMFKISLFDTILRKYSQNSTCQHLHLQLLQEYFTRTYINSKTFIVYRNSFIQNKSHSDIKRQYVILRYTNFQSAKINPTGAEFCWEGGGCSVLLQIMAQISQLTVNKSVQMPWMEFLTLSRSDPAKI